MAFLVEDDHTNLTTVFYCYHQKEFPPFCQTRKPALVKLEGAYVLFCRSCRTPARVVCNYVKVRLQA